MNDYIRKTGEFMRDAVQESTRQTISDHRDDGHRRGFTGAAGITLHRIQEKLDGIKAQRKGPGLTDAEYAVYAQLDELKSEIEADCDRYWRGSGVNWRPLKPVAKAVVRRTGEPLLED